MHFECAIVQFYLYICTRKREKCKNTDSVMQNIMKLLV